MAYCSKCGSPLQEGAAFCSSCGTKVFAGGVSSLRGMTEKKYLSDNAGMRFVLPIGCTGWAIAAGYCGLCSFIPFLGILLAILSIIFGSIAIAVIRRNPHKHGIARIVIGWIIAIPSLITQIIFLVSFL